MRRLFIGMGLMVAFIASAAEVKLSSDKDKISYALGMDIGRNITNQNLEINTEALASGITAVVSGGQTQLTQQEATDFMQKFRQEMQAKQQERFKKMQAEQAGKNKEAGEKNKKEGETFLAENKTKEGVKVHPVKLPNGQTAELQYKVITTGTGPKPTTTDTVKTHYRGTLINGTEFDSSYKRGEPASFPVTGVIKGWTEALLMMPVGSKWQLFIPSELAYGDRGQGQNIGPNSTLLFDIELLAIEPKGPAPANTAKP